MRSPGLFCRGLRLDSVGGTEDTTTSEGGVAVAETVMEAMGETVHQPVGATSAFSRHEVSARARTRGTLPERSVLRRMDRQESLYVFLARPVRPLCSNPGTCTAHPHSPIARKAQNLSPASFGTGWHCREHDVGRDNSTISRFFVFACRCS